MGDMVKVADLGTIDWSLSLTQKVWSAYKNGPDYLSFQFRFRFILIVLRSQLSKITSDFVSQVFKNRIYRKAAKAMSADLS